MLNKVLNNNNLNSMLGCIEIIKYVIRIEVSVKENNYKRVDNK